VRELVEGSHHEGIESVAGIQVIALIYIELVQRELGVRYWRTPYFLGFSGYILNDAIFDVPELV
jgi:hypothetical protein